MDLCLSRRIELNANFRISEPSYWYHLDEFSNNLLIRGFITHVYKGEEPKINSSIFLQKKKK